MLVHRFYTAGMSRLLLGYRVVLLVALAATVLAAAIGPGAVWAQDLTVHIVQAGESLSALAIRYGTTVDALVMANDLRDPDSIQAGQTLVIPANSGVPSTVGPAMTSGGTYVVQSADTLAGIAFRYGLHVWDLLLANGVQGPHQVAVGQTIVIPGAGGLIPEVDPDSTRMYIVRAGDSLAEIAERFRSTAFGFAVANALVEPSDAHAGRILRLPASYTGAKRISIDLSDQRLYAYEGDNTVLSFVASSGRAPFYTRVGEFQVQSKIPNAYGSTWGIWMPNWLGIYWAGGTENGIHALPILASGQTLWAGYLGTPISYGCIVLDTYDAQTLYDWAEIGTPVAVHY